MLDQILVAFMCSWVFSYYSPLTIPLQISKGNGVPLQFSKGACWWITTENSHLWDSQSVSMESLIHFFSIWYIYNHIITIEKYHKNWNFCMVLKRTHNGPQLRKLIFFFKEWLHAIKRLVFFSLSQKTWVLHIKTQLPWGGKTSSTCMSNGCCFLILVLYFYLLFAVIIYSKVSYMVASNSLH